MKTPPAIEPQLTRSSRLARSGVHLVALLMIVIALWMLASFVGQVITSSQIERQVTQLNAQNDDLASEIERLKARVDYARSPVYTERIAREQLGYAREGDTVLLPTFADAPPEEAKANPRAIPAPAQIPNWQRWVSALFPPAK